MRWPRLLKRASGAPLSEVSIDPAVARFTSLLTGTGFSSRFFDQLWVANRSCQLNAQMIASMPLRFYGKSTPAWTSNPDPHWFPNGISEAVFAAVWDMYAWGDAFLYVTDRYANGFPSAWTVLPAATMNVKVENGAKVYRSGQNLLDAGNMVQVTRDPRGGLRGTSALQSYATHLWSAEAVDATSQALAANPTPNAVLKSMKKLTAEQAELLQSQWVARTSARSGAPAVLDPGIDFQQLAFAPKDLLLLDMQVAEGKTISSAFGVPPVLLNMSMEGGLLYQNPAQLFELWWRSELLPGPAHRIAEALTAQMLPSGSWVEFDARDVLAPTFAELVAAWNVILTQGAATVNEFRAAVLRLPPIEGGDAIQELTQPAVANANNNVPLLPVQMTNNMEVRQ